MRQITLKKPVASVSSLGGSARVVFAATFACFMSAASLSAHGSANVFDDAVFWFRGGKDLNGDGYMQKGEFFDDLNADKTEHDYHKMSVPSYSGSVAGFRENALFQREQVVLPALGTKTTETMQFLHISDVVITNAGNGYYYPFYVNPHSVFEDKNISNEYTIISRLRLGDLNSEECLFRIGFNETATNGMWLGLVKHPNYAACKYITVKCSPNTGAKMTTHNLDMRIPTNTWVDVAVIVGKGSLRVGVAAPTSYSQNYPSIAFAETPMWTANCELIDETHYSLFCFKTTAATKTDQPCFHGDVQQLAIWGRALSDQEVMSAFGMPRPAIFRIGLDNGASNEFGGKRTASTQTIDGLGSWQNIANTMKAGDIWTVNFNALRDEANLPQIFSIKSLSDSAAAQIEVELNETPLGEGRVAADSHAFWPVAANLVSNGVNTLVIKRKDSRTRDFLMDAMELGGSLGVGSASHVINDGRVYPEQIATGIPSAADPNPAHWPVGFRPYYQNNTNLYFNVWVDPDVVGACTSRFWTCVQCKKYTGTVTGKEYFTIFVNKEEVTNFNANSSWVDISLDFNPGVLHGGWNDFEIRSAEAYTTLYWLFDRYRFETVLPNAFGFTPPPPLMVIIR